MVTAKWSCDDHMDAEREVRGTRRESVEVVNSLDHGHLKWSSRAAIVPPLVENADNK